MYDVRCPPCYCTDIEEYCPALYIILHELASILQYQCNNPLTIQYQIFQSVTIHLTKFFVTYNYDILFISRLLARHANTILLESSLVRTTNGMQYRSKCNMLSSFGNALLFMQTSKNIGNYCIFILQRNLHEIFYTMYIIRSFISGKQFLFYSFQIFQGPLWP